MSATSNDTSPSGIICAHTLRRAHRYGELKKSLARRFPDDIEGYCDGKEVFMQELERAALTWYRCGKGIL